MSHSWGYKQAAKMSKDIGLAPTKPARVEVKTHSRAPRSPKSPPLPVSPAKDTPKLAGTAIKQPRAKFLK